MGIKTYNPYTPSRRNMTGSDFSEITASSPEKSLCTSLKKNAGRNNQGKITVRHQGGGSRRKYRIIDFKRNAKDGIPAVVKTVEYDPNRTANIALICYADGEKAYILAPEGLKVGQKIMNGIGSSGKTVAEYAGLASNAAKTADTAKKTGGLIRSLGRAVAAPARGYAQYVAPADVVVGHALAPGNGKNKYNNFSQDDLARLFDENVY